MKTKLLGSLTVLAVFSAFCLPSAFAAPAKKRLLTRGKANEGYSHPLDPLDGAEITEAVKIIMASEKFPKGAMFPIVVLKEPPKEEVLEYREGTPFRREAFAVIYDRNTNKTYEAVADLRGSKLASWTPIPGVQPNFLVEELNSGPEIVRADPRWQEAMRKRGITDFNDVQIDGWAPGTLGVTTAEGPRLIHALSFNKAKAGSNVYSRPIEGVTVVVDMNQRKVIEFVDTGVVPVSTDPGQLDPGSVGPLREKVKPLKIVQSKGHSFELRGHEVRWSKWRFRYAMHPREGLVLYQVGYEDGGKVRPILYRASLSEMVVPYGDPDKAWAWRSAFDVGEYGIGRLSSTLVPARDVPENAVLLDSDFVDDFGKAYVGKSTATIYERDGGMLWKHFDINVNHNETRRGRELVISFLAGVGNYDYGINWIFRQDGSLELQADLSGIMLSKGVNVTSMSDDGAHATMHQGHLVAPNVAAPHHQHFFNFRLDFDVDGTKNTVVEANSSPLPPGDENPYLNAFKMEETVLKTEKQAQRDLSLENARKWVVINPAVKNSLGMNTGYAFIPGDNSVPYINPDSLVRKRAGFVNHPIWVTKYKPDEMNAGGYYPNQSRGGDGLPQWVSDNENVENEDLVLWYTTGVTHIPRPEDWPVMPVLHIGFKLLPVNFFTRNPAMDLP